MNPGQGFRTQGRGGAFDAPMVSKTGINLRITEKKLYFCRYKERVYGCTNRTELETAFGSGI